MTAKQRHGMLLIALAGTAAWSVWLAVNETPPESDSDLVALARPASHKSQPTTPPPSGIATQIQPHQPEGEVRLALSKANLFPEQTWYIPPPPPPPPAYVPPPPPQAPALPFKYMGRWQEAGNTTYYLMRGTLPVNVRAGQTLDGVWQLEPVNGSVLNFTYLPLNQTRSLRTGD